jgi:hypothetical protein
VLYKNIVLYETTVSLIIGKSSTGFVLLWFYRKRESITGVSRQRQDVPANMACAGALRAKHAWHATCPVSHTRDMYRDAPGKCANSVRCTMEKIKQQRPATPAIPHPEHHRSAYRPEPMAMLSGDEVRRQLGWFLVSSQREHGR